MKVSTYPEVHRSSLQQPLLPMRDLALLLLLWAAAMLVDSVWLTLDQAPPAWDQGEHLTRALNYWKLLQQPEWLNGEWWQQLWRLSPTYRAPFVYLATVPLLTLIGRGFDQAVLVNSLFTGMLLLLIYGLGRGFDRLTGLWAATLCLLVPGLVVLRTDYLLDYGLTVVVLAAFACLTGWRTAGARTRWLWALSFGVCAGLLVLAKPTGILFLVIPILWIAGLSFRRLPQGDSGPWRHWIQWGLAAVVAWLICGPWIQTNWLTILSTSGQSNASWLAAELDPQNPLSVGSYYARMLPRMVTYPLLGVGLGGYLLWLLTQGRRRPEGESSLGKKQETYLSYSVWLLGMVLGTYLLFSLLSNKDPRHVVPYVPIVVLLLVRGITQWSGRIAQLLRYGLLATMFLLMLGAMFPLGSQPFMLLKRHPYQGQPWPQPQVIDSVLESAPYLRSTIGVLPNTIRLNPMNVDFYGALADFRVFGREVGFNAEFSPLDARSLEWVLAKEGEQGPQNSLQEAKVDLQQRVEASPNFDLHQSWILPDASELRLYRRLPQTITVTPIDDLGQLTTEVSLVYVDTPPLATAGVVPVTYTLRGNWDSLQNGLLMLSWRLENQADGTPQWIHDHGIGLGHLYQGFRAPPQQGSFQVTERLGMIIPEGVPEGQYRLVARYINRETGVSQPLTTPNISITVGTTSPSRQTSLQIPEPDLVSQLHQLSQGLADGAIDPIFNTVGRINQYDPVQDYLVQAEQAMTERLSNQPGEISWFYTQVMAQVLQQHAEDAIATLTQLTQVAPENPYHWLFLAFVHIYSWQPGRANQALMEAEALDPTMAELKLLQGAVALQRLNIPKAWRLFKASGVL